MRYRIVITHSTDSNFSAEYRFNDFAVFEGILKTVVRQYLNDVSGNWEIKLLDTQPNPNLTLYQIKKELP